MEIKNPIQSADTWLNKKYLSRMSIGEKYQVRRNKGITLFTDNKPHYVFGYKIDEKTNRTVTTPHFVTILSDVYERDEIMILDTGERYKKHLVLFDVSLDDDSTVYSMCVNDVQFLKFPK